MSTYVSPLRQRIRETAQSLQIKSRRESLAAQAMQLSCRVLSDMKAVTVPGGAFGIESFHEVVPQRNQAFDLAQDGDVHVLMAGLKDLNMSARHIEEVTEQVVRTLDNKFDMVGSVTGAIELSQKHTPLAQVIGRTAATRLESVENTVGREAFGDDINRLATDDRLTMSLIIMRPWDNIIDKGFARVSESSPIVTVRVPSPEAYDWATTQQANSTSSSRNGASNTYRLRDLYRNPSAVNTAAKKVVALAANDSNAVLWNGTTAYYKTGRDVSLLDLSRDASRITYDKVDKTDLISDGGVLDNIIVKVVSGSTTEYFKLPTRTFNLAMYVPSPSSKKSGQRQVIMEAVLPISSTTTQWDGSASTIAASLTDAKIQLNVSFTSTLDIQTGVQKGSGTINGRLIAKQGVSAVSSSTATAYGNMVFTVDAYSTDVYFDEENQRKANLSVWVQYYEQQFVVPRSRIYFTEYALTQEIDDNAVAATSSMVALGNGRRGLNTIVDALSDIAQGLQLSVTNPEISSSNQTDEQSFASALVKPTVVTTTLDFTTEELNTMNESTRLTEIHGRFRARFLSMVTMMMAKSLMINQYKGGETPVLKAWVHQSIADIVIGILDYHPDLQDRATTATGADFSMTLPNGYRLDVIKSNLDCLQQRLFAVPVIESDMASVLSAGSIRDCGTVTTNYVPTIGGSTTRRVATTTREIVFMSNKVGICMIIKGLAAQLGDVGYTPVKLNDDYSDSLAA